MGIARIEYFPAHVRVGCLRVWDDPAAEFGDPYDWACTSAFDPRLDRLSLHGVDKPHTRDQGHDVIELLTQNQIRFLEYERRTADRIRQVVHDLHRRRRQ